MDDFSYAREDGLDWREFRDVLISSTLGARRPVDDEARLRRMCAQADLIVTCRTPDGHLAGVARSLSDFAFCTYLSDLAVDAAFQRRGIGKMLIAETHRLAGLHTTLILLAAPAAADYYGHIGMEQRPSWVIPRQA